jgi:hypothetical protein
MTSLNTLPIPRIRPATQTHEHAWLMESRHPTSEGTVLYVRCDECGAVASTCRRTRICHRSR